MISSQAPNRVPRPNCYVLLARDRGGIECQGFGPLLFLLMVLLAVPMQAGCAARQVLTLKLPPQPISYSVKLDWIASTSPVIGYNVYRGTETGGPYTLVRFLLVNDTQYEDSSVQSGQI